MAKKIKYSEPSSYFPKSVRKEFGLGEYAEKKSDEKKSPAKKGKNK